MCSSQVPAADAQVQHRGQRNRRAPPSAAFVPFFFYGASLFCPAAHSPRSCVPVMAGEIAFYTVWMLCQEGGQLPGWVQTGYALRAFSRRAGHYLLEKQALRWRFLRVRARGARGGLLLSTVLPHSVRMGTRVLETLDNMREILSYDSIGCKQALPIFEELVSRPGARG